MLLPVTALLGVAALSTLGLEADQVQLKKSYRWLGAIGVAYGLGADSWFYILGGCCASMRACTCIRFSSSNLCRLRLEWATREFVRPAWSWQELNSKKI